MYSYIMGEDNHFDLKWCKNRKEAERSLKSMIELYNICYDIKNADYGVITDRELCEKFDSKYHNSYTVRRLGDELLERVRLMKNGWKE